MRSMHCCPRPMNGRRAQALPAQIRSRSNARPTRRLRSRLSFSKLSSIRSPASCRSSASSRDARRATPPCSIRRAGRANGSVSSCGSRARSSRPSLRPFPAKSSRWRSSRTRRPATPCDEKAPVIFPPPERPAPVISFAIRPKTKGDEEKASQALQRLVEEDRALETHRDPQTHDIILSGTGQMHIEVTVEKLKRKFNVEVELQAPKVPYKETIKGRAEAQS